MHARDILVLDSVTKFGPEAHGAVAIAASHGGVFAAHAALAAGIVGLLLNDAGVGLDRAGIGGLAYCDALGVPCAAIDHRSARIGDGADNAARGVVSHANRVASRLGVRAGMSAGEAARCLQMAGLSPVDPGPLPQESREVLMLTGAQRPLVLVDSASLVEPADRGAVVFTGSHGGLLGGRPETALKVDAFAALYNDAGIGIDDAGISRLAALDARGIAGVTVAARSARIGEARSAYDTGVLSRVNRSAFARGAREGMQAAEFGERMCRVDGVHGVDGAAADA
ncbi:MAG: hypothetical protein KJ901_23220 [Gammaproteobacteria bacterium]|nr:hypothetical protein [Gammaproteobacteria bacterium]